MKFDSSFFGQQETSDTDTEYRGSRYADVRQALFHNAYYLTWGADGEPPLPVYDVSLGRVLKGIVSDRRWRFFNASERALESPSDLRWGHNGRGFRRLLHPNGVCLFGRWIINAPTQYSGYFSQGSEALIIGRYSACCSETRRGFRRSMSLVAKIFPTSDPKHEDLLRTANFITQQDLGGARTLNINDAVLRNAPDVSPLQRGWGLPVLLVTGLAFKRADSEPTVRQLYPIAELGKPSEERTRAPGFMQLRVDADQPIVAGREIDFRDEILGQIYDRGNTAPQRQLVFTIEVTDELYSRGRLRRRRFFPDGWQRIGRIVFDEAVASYNGDFVIHFQHPVWRNDRNDPRTVVRGRHTKIA